MDLLKNSLILLSLIKACQSSTNTKDYLLEKIFVKTFSKNNDFQIITWMDHGTINLKGLDNVLEGQQAVNFDNELSTQDALSKLKSVKRVAMPAVIVLDDEDGTKLDILLKSILGWQHHVIILIQNEGTLSSQDLPFTMPPIIHLNQFINSQEQTKAELFCPKVGKPKRTTVDHLATCLDGMKCSFSRTFHKIISIDQLCQEPFKGQIVTFQALPVVPLVLLPSLVGKLSGFSINLFLLYAKKYGFKSKIELVRTTGHYIPQNQTFTPGSYQKVMTREADVTDGGIADLMLNLMDISSPSWHINEKLITRKPKPLPPYTNILRPFSSRIWLILLATLEIICALFAIINKVYAKPYFQKVNLARYEPSTYLFFLYPMFKVTEPDPLPWFKKWSAGKVLNTAWIFMAMITVILYNCNLRSCLVTIQYEQAPETVSDIVLNGQTVYLPIENVKHGIKYLEYMGKQGTPKHDMAKLALKTDGYFWATQVGRFPKRSPKDIMDNGAALFMEQFAIKYLYKMDPLMEMPNIHVTEESLGDYYICHTFTKYSPGTKHFSRVARRALETGLMKFWLNEHLSMKASLTVKSPRVGLEPFNLEQLFLPFICCCFGLLSAAIGFTSEIR